MATSEQIGLALQGFGAGLQGQGAQFQQLMQQREKQQAELDIERQKAAITDNRAGLMHLKAGDVVSAEKLYANRIANIQRLGGDPSDTIDQLYKLRTEGPEAAINNAMALDREAVARGILDPLKVAEADKVQSSQILPDGSTVQVFKSGQTRVTGADGEELTGEERINAVRAAQEYGAEVQGKRSLERTAGAESAKTSAELGKEAFGQLQGVRRNISNLDRVVELIDKGAGSGPIEKLFPSIRSTSIELDNMRNNLGLDVIAGTTFGALSESELEFALDSALPTGLDGPELREWALRKKDAQNKLAAELGKAAKFFSMSGTIGDYMALLDKQASGKPGQESAPAPAAPAAAPGGVKFLGFE